MRNTKSFEPKSNDLVDYLSERVSRENRRVTDLERKNIQGVWIDPDICEFAYTFKNGFGQAGAPEELFRYRLFAVDVLQVVGTLTAGTSGSIAFRLLPPFIQLLSGDIHFFGNVLDTPTVVAARFDVDYTTGDVTVTYP